MMRKDDIHGIVKIDTQNERIYKTGIPCHAAPIVGQTPDTECDSCCGQAVCYCPALALAALHAELEVDWKSLLHQVLLAVEVEYPAVETVTVRLWEGWRGLGDRG